MYSFTTLLFFVGNQFSAPSFSVERSGTEKEGAENLAEMTACLTL